MKHIIQVTLIATIAILLGGCNQKLDKVLFGTWSVTKVEGTLNQGGVGIYTATDDDPSGTVKFNSNGTGRQDYSFTFIGTVYTQQDDFKWEAQDDEIVINRVSEPDMIWARILDTEDKQVASYRIIVDAQQSWDYTLTLEK